MTSLGDDAHEVWWLVDSNAAHDYGKVHSAYHSTHPLRCVGVAMIGVWVIFEGGEMRL
jgi:hypothetical protein